MVRNEKWLPEQKADTSDPELYAFVDLVYMKWSNKFPNDRRSVTGDKACRFWSGPVQEFITLRQQLQFPTSTSTPTTDNKSPLRRVDCSPDISSVILRWVRRTPDLINRFSKK